MLLATPAGVLLMRDVLPQAFGPADLARTGQSGRREHTAGPGERQS